MAMTAFNNLDEAAAEPATVGEQFLKLDPGCVSDAIPAFFIGRNKDGFWVARDARDASAGSSCSRPARGPLQEGTATRVRDDLPGRGVRARPQEYGQSPYHVSWIVETPGNALAAANGGLDWRVARRVADKLSERF